MVSTSQQQIDAIQKHKTTSNQPKMIMAAREREIGTYN
jgi:hypothetical protein